MKNLVNQFRPRQPVLTLLLCLTVGAVGTLHLFQRGGAIPLTERFLGISSFAETPELLASACSTCKEASDRLVAKWTPDAATYPFGYKVYKNVGSTQTVVCTNANANASECLIPNLSPGSYWFMVKGVKSINPDVEEDICTACFPGETPEVIRPMSSNGGWADDDPTSIDDTVEEFGAGWTEGDKLRITHSDDGATQIWGLTNPTIIFSYSKLRLHINYRKLGTVNEHPSLEVKLVGPAGSSTSSKNATPPDTQWRWAREDGAQQNFLEWTTPTTLNLNSLEVHAKAHIGNTENLEIEAVYVDVFPIRGQAPCGEEVNGEK